jgi:hypothetical protein
VPRYGPGLARGQHVNDQENRRLDQELRLHRYRERGQQRSQSAAEQHADTLQSLNSPD